MECAFTSPVRTECGMFVMYCMQCCMSVSCNGGPIYKLYLPRLPPAMGAQFSGFFSGGGETGHAHPLDGGHCCS